MKERYLDVIKSSRDLAGLSSFCNICGYRFSKFIPFNSRDNARCPVCSSLERHRHLYIHLLHFAPLMKGKKILHFAPEKILKQFFMSLDVDYFDADIDKDKATYVEDITNISVDDDIFDYCVAIHVLEHIVDDIKALKEIYRVLKPGGIAFLAVPLSQKLFEDPKIISPEERTKYFGQSDHVRKYDEETFLARIKSVGFGIQISKPDLFPKLLQKECRLGNPIIIATKEGRI